MHNYRIVIFFESAGLDKRLPQITNAMEKIKKEKCPFLDKDQSMSNELSLSLTDLIDELYIKKKQGILLREYEKYQDKIFIVIDEHLRDPSLMESVLLLLYFYEDTFIHFDKSFKRHLASSHIQST